ncbi:O-methyltransferase [Rugamonas sp.]|uniref:O-methyltransferase n=1 Tax=Rugamonas sp. TaxID=1926287 RepID=UPI0025FE9F19|nr:class I SAM-dependent methyltransferase [Rugamonas sp.]
MDLHALLCELEDFGIANDDAHAERERRMLNITRDTGELLAVMVKARAARHILEIGTSNGYSTLWLASAAAPLGGVVTTVEWSEMKYDLARANFARAGLGGAIRALHADAGQVLAHAADGAYEMVFLDSDRSAYVAWWPQIRRVLAAGGVLVVDNAISHREEMAGLTAAIAADAGFTSCLVPVGKGELMAVKHPA